MVMADNQSSDIGSLARHPLRTMGGAALIGTALGMSLMSAKNRRDKTPMQKFMDKLNKYEIKK
jgi:hypothetical protein